MEIYVDCPIEVCAKRDKKGIYAKAKAGIIKEFTGISAPYEPPANPDLLIDSSTEDPILAANRVQKLMVEKGIF